MESNRGRKKEGCEEVENLRLKIKSSPLSRSVEASIAMSSRHFNSSCELLPALADCRSRAWKLRLWKLKPRSATRA